MKIKNRLALYFSLISAGVLLFTLVVIYFIFYTLFKNDFYQHLNDRAKVAAQLYFEADEISTDSLNHVRERYLAKLPDEILGLYDEHDQSFIGDSHPYWSSSIINNIRKRKFMQFTDGKRQAVGIYYNDNQGDFVILVSAFDRLSYDRLRKMAQMMLLFFILTNGLLFLVGRWFAQKSLSPIDNLVKQLNRISVNNLHLRVEEGEGKDEITALARYFNLLLEHLQNAFELQQAFVTNASHELRTPVTSTVGEIEVALNRLRTPEEYQKTLRSVLLDAERLNETITSLLELAQTDMEYTQAKREPVMIDELIWDLHDYWKRQKDVGKLLLEILKLPEDAESLTVFANKALLTIAFNNLIGNAFKFSNNQPVICTLYADNEVIYIEITDRGIGIPTEDIQKIFTSFYRSPNGRSFQGSGIGLYVTQKIIHLFNGVVLVEPQKDTGTKFTVKFRPSAI
ncbi:ATP-binding protein [Mucilaginibacter sp. SP1R1]|uniref:ATP-binding protein n=1 Tax=Mucilaginibacter sp. SP1R1 TaxID=2723091 RepID=UPI001622D3B2|nr:ATP-binding protein [Mucilaginibacter sp. SP1R1]MBB6148545.1 signal transduction histidine kinase [Mucilaginibacter sp. SP1R1]